MNKTILKYTAICFVFLLIAIWVISMELAVKTGIRFFVAPDNINVNINDESYKVNYETSIELKPGKYHVKLSRSDFITDEQDITVSQNKITKIYSALEPANESGKKIISSDVMQERRRVIFGNSSSSGPEAESKKYPFVNKLPIIEKYYVINPCYGPENNQAFGICVTLATDNPTIREKALQSLKDNNIDATNTTIYFHQNTP